MSKIKITISLDDEVADKLRRRAYDKYHNSRSLSKLIEDMANGAVEAEEPDVCAVLGARSDKSYDYQKRFNEAIDDFTEQLKKIDTVKYTASVLSPTGAYFAFKEACELELNQINKNTCWSCYGIRPDPPMYPDAGKNFVEWSKVESVIR